MPLVTVADLESGGFYGWWSPVDKLLGNFEPNYGHVRLVNTLWAVGRVPPPPPPYEGVTILRLDA